jgi:hypothetical protein
MPSWLSPRGAGLDLFYGLLPDDNSTPDTTVWNPGQGKVFVTLDGFGIRIDAMALKLSSPTVSIDKVRSDPKSAAPFTPTFLLGSHVLLSSGDVQVVNFN